MHNIEEQAVCYVRMVCIIYFRVGVGTYFFPSFPFFFGSSNTLFCFKEPADNSIDFMIKSVLFIVWTCIFCDIIWSSFACAVGSQLLECGD